MGARRSVDEEALMQAYAEGDADAFQQLFDSLSPALQAFFRRSVQDAGVAEDLVQTTFLKLHVARRRWRRGERFRPWVFAIAANIRVDWYRSRGRREPDELVDDAAQDHAGRRDPRDHGGRGEAACFPGVRGAPEAPRRSRYRGWMSRGRGPALGREWPEDLAARRGPRAKLLRGCPVRTAASARTSQTERRAGAGTAAPR
jgi:RNA polymerase sigma factor (sigma-70 family)